MEVGKDRIAELVVQMQNGNSKAFDELYKLTSSRAYFVALQITKNEQDAEDVLQESYVSAIAKINTLDKPESFVSWLHHIVANKSKDSLKKKKPTLFEGGEDEAFEVIPDEDTSFSPEENLNQEELQKAVMEVIGELTEEKRACVLMMYFEEMSVNEIAETLDVPVSTVKNRLFTARKDLKAKFEKRGITSVYSVAPIGVIVWALSRTADAVSKTFAGSQASAQILTGITAASSATAATTAATTAASAGTGVAAKFAALTVAQKVVAGVAVTGVVAASAAGAATVVNMNKEETTTEVTTAYVEEVTTAPTTLSTTAIMAIVQSETETTVQTTAEKTTVRTTVATTVKREPTATTAAPTTKPSTTENTTKKKTTRRTTTRRDYSLDSTSTTKVTTTLAETTTATTTTTTTTTEPETTTTTTTRATTAAPTTTETTATTTKAASATVVMKVYDMDDNVVDTVTKTIEAGESITNEFLDKMALDAGYRPYGIYVEKGESHSVGVVAESGVTYAFRAEL